MSQPSGEPFAAPSTSLRGLYGTTPDTLPTPAATVQEIGGQVDLSGVKVGGAGFTVSRTSAGFYVVVYTVTFLTTPTVVCQTADFTGTEVTGLAASSATGFTFKYSPAVDHAFNFIAKAQ